MGNRGFTMKAWVIRDVLVTGC